MSSSASQQAHVSNHDRRTPPVDAVRSEVFKRIDALPSLSSVVSEFLELTRREHFTARDFEKVLARDQALVARLLRSANSAFYAPRRPVSTIPEAVVLLGLQEMKRIVYCVSAAGWLRQSLRHYGYARPDGFWLHAMGVGVGARSIADLSPNCPLNAEEAFVAGLLHDIGKPVIDEFLDLPDPDEPVTRTNEIAAVGVDHAELAMVILTQWKLPENIVTAVGEHHTTAGTEISPLAAPVCLSQQFCRTWQVGVRHPMNLSEEVVVDSCTDLLDVLGLTEERVPQVIWDVRQNLVGLEDRFTLAD